MTRRYQINSEKWFELRTESIAILRSSARPMDTVSEYSFKEIKSIQFNDRKTNYFLTILVLLLFLLFQAQENPFIGKRRGMTIKMHDGAEVFIDLNHCKLRKALSIYNRTMNRVKRSRKRIQTE